MESAQLDVKVDAAAVRTYLTGLQASLVAAFGRIDGGSFRRDEWQRGEGGGGVSCVLEDSKVFERGGVGFSHVFGEALPPSASAVRPELAGRSWQAMGVSVVMHPRNPRAPTVHLNVRFFVALPPVIAVADAAANDTRPAARDSALEPELNRAEWRGRKIAAADQSGDASEEEVKQRFRELDERIDRAAKRNREDRRSEDADEADARAKPIWWFGGGMDLTPYYGYNEDAIHWHRNCRDALAPFGADYYPRYKKWCDDYFFIKHRSEPRGIGGIFFDDLSQPDFRSCFALMQSVSNSFLPGYLPILERRMTSPYGQRERDFQLYRRGRYVEFNLVYDRGTLFGLQSGGRAESILMSLPPNVSWRYDWQPEAGSEEDRLYKQFLIRKDWL